MHTLADYQTKVASPSRIEGGYRLLSNIKQQTDSKDFPLVSIITVVRNGESTLEHTMLSVLNQIYANIEYIVIDGASTDNTLEIIRKYDQKIAYWISEPDKGIADAWNKGIANCTGDIIGILNAGDYFDKNCVADIVKALPAQGIGFSYGKTILVDKDGRIVSTISGNFRPQKLAMGVGFLHPGCFATRRTYEKVGLFSTSYRMAMDCDWILRCYQAGVSFKKLNNVCYMQDGGLSNQFAYSAYGEYLQAMRNNGFSELQVRAAMAQYGFYLFSREFLKRLIYRHKI